MVRKLLYDPRGEAGRPMRVAGFMSGSGTNIRKILEKQKALEQEEGKSPYKLVLLFSDVEDPAKCKIREIATEYNLPYRINDIWTFYRSRGHTTKRDMNVRKEFDKETLEYLQENNIDCIALGGYMSIVTEILFEVFPTINVHPADLSIIDLSSGKRKYTGDHAVRDAIVGGEPEIRSSTHIATAEVDGGPLLLISKPVKVTLPPNITVADLAKSENNSLLSDLEDFHQNQLKEVGDWVIFPLSLIYLGKGLIEIDEKGLLYIDGQLCPHGLKL